MYYNLAIKQETVTKRVENIFSIIVKQKYYPII